MASLNELNVAAPLTAVLPMSAMSLRRSSPLWAVGVALLFGYFAAAAAMVHDFRHPVESGAAVIELAKKAIVPGT